MVSKTRCAVMSSYLRSSSPMRSAHGVTLVSRGARGLLGQRAVRLSERGLVPREELAHGVARDPE